jgi:hypothetical protein
LDYPIGVPTVLSFKPNERRPALWEFLHRWEGELVPGLWQVIVRGPLPFEQDLIPSTILTAERVAGAPRRGELEGHFAFLRREIVNGVITADVLNAVRRVATNTERRAFLGLEVVTACFYRASDRRDMNAWVDGVLAAEDGGVRACCDPGERPDQRPTLWHGVPLEGFISRLVDERRRLKARARGGDPGAGPRDAVLKLLVNTLYGDLASRHVELGSVVLANNITARARVGVWMPAKALGLRQTITDGGFYCPDAVPHWQGKRPGLASLSNLERWAVARDRRRTWQPLGARAWTPGVCPDDADAVARQHVCAFWGPYGPQLPFALEHKRDHAFLAAAYWSKADHAFQLPDGRRILKTRGKKPPRPGETEHPRRVLLNTILDGGDAYPSELNYRRGEILKIGRYLQALESKGYGWLDGLRPGDTVPPRRHTARDNNTHVPLLTAAEWKQRHGRRTHRRGRPVEWFEAWRDHGIRAVLRHMVENRLRSGVRREK